jgi:hypothetical protein
MADDAPPAPSVESILIAEREGYWEARVRPTDSFPRVMAQMEELRVFCADRKPARVLLDMRGYLGTLTITDRYELGNFGGHLQGLVGRMAAMARSELVDPQKFAVRVAQNRGLNVELFIDPEEAVRWLLRP